MKRLGLLLLALCMLFSASAFADDHYYYLINGTKGVTDGNGVTPDGIQYASPDAACQVMYNEMETTLTNRGYTVASPYTSPTLSYSAPPNTAYYTCTAKATQPPQANNGQPLSQSLGDTIVQQGDNCTDAQTYNPTSGQCENPSNDQNHNEQGDVDDAQAALGVGICPPTKTQGDPINASMGNEYESETDYQDSDGELRFIRYYNSSSGGWTHSYNMQLVMSPNVLQLYFEDGHSALFKVSNGLATAQPPELGTLTQVSGRWVYTSPTNEQFTFDSSGRLVVWRQANGLAQTLVYTTNPDYSSSATVTDSRGHTLSWHNSNYGLTTQLTAGDLTVAYTWNMTPSYAFQLTQVASTRASHTSTRTYAYGDSRNPLWLTGITDERGIAYASWTYDAQGRALTSQHAGGVDLTTVTYNSDGTSTVTNALGNSVTYTYQVVQGVNRITHIAGSPAASCPASNSTFAYYPNGQLQTKTDALGHITAYTYDTQGRLLTRVDAQGTPQERTTTTTWDTTWPYLPHTIATADHTTTYSYDTQGRLLSTTVHDTKASAPDQTWARTYNAQGLVATIDGPRTDVSDITQYQYDTQGHLSTVTDALGHVTTYGNYDSYSNPLQITDANGVVTTLTYTPQEWPLTITRDSSGTPSTTTLTYDAAGDLTQTQDADGVTLTYTYDNARRLTDITDGAGNRIHYTLDAAGNRTKEETFDPSNTLTHSVSRTFNNLSQLLTVVDALNRTVLTYSYPDGYDAAGHPIHSADALGTQRTQGYDALDRLVSTIDNANGTDTATQNTQTTSTFDSSDNLTSVVDPTSLTTSYTYDGLGHRTQLQSPDTGASSDTYDAAGNRLVHTDAKGVVSTTAYDALNRPATTTFADPTLNITYAYDEANSATGCTSSAPIGRLTRIIENAVTTAYCYDARGNVIQKRQATTGNTDVTSYTYSLGNRLKQLITPDGTIIFDSYNALGQLSGVQVIPVGGNASAVVSNISYLPFGPMSSYTLGNGQVVTRTYDATYALTDLTSPALNLHFARDPLGRIVAEGAGSGASPASESYKYDPLSRLTEVDDANGNPIQTYTYNKTGDRLTKTGNALATGTYGYQANTHWLTSIGNAARTYDANGNTTGNSVAGQTYGYGYNSRNRMTVVQLGGNTVGTYSYNALGQRIGKVATLPSAITERFVYDEQGGLIGEYGSTTRDYIWMSGIPVGALDTVGSTRTMNYVTADHLGTPRAVSDGTGATLWSWAWLGNPFGELAPVSSTGYTLNLRFPGQYFDAESGLLHNGYRDYCVECGRYIQSDPIGLQGGLSTYAYVGSSPIGRVDAFGLQFPIGEPVDPAAVGADEGAAAKAAADAAAADEAAAAAMARMRWVDPNDPSTWPPTYTPFEQCPASGSPRVIYPRGSGAATGEMPPGYSMYTRWASAEEAALWLENEGTAIPSGIGGDRVYVTALGAPQPGGTGPIQINFGFPQGGVSQGGNSQWWQIYQPVSRVPIYNTSLTVPNGMKIPGH